MSQQFKNAAVVEVCCGVSILTDGPPGCGNLGFFAKTTKRGFNKSQNYNTYTGIYTDISSLNESSFHFFGEQTSFKANDF